MNQSRVYMCPPILNPLPPPSPSLPSGLSQCTGFECPVSCIGLGLVIYFTHGNIHVSMLFSQFIPPLSHSSRDSLVCFCFLQDLHLITLEDGKCKQSSIVTNENQKSLTNLEVESPTFLSIIIWNNYHFLLDLNTFEGRCSIIFCFASPSLT